MKGDALLILIILGFGLLAGLIAYSYLSLKEEVNIEYPSIPSIPKYSDISFSPISKTPGKLPTEYLDLRKEYFEFPYYLENTFTEKTEIKVCPFIAYEINGRNGIIDGECQSFELNPEEKKEGYIRIPLKNKEELKNSTKILVGVNISYSSSVNSLCDLYIEEGYPSCTTPKTSDLKFYPILIPNPIKPSDSSFSVDLQLEKYGERLIIKGIEVKPLETIIRRKSRDREIEERIGVSGECNLKEEIEIVSPKELIKVCSLPSPKIEVKEKNVTGSFKQSLQINCESEIAKKLKICEIAKENREILKKIPIYIKVNFEASKIYSYKVYL